MTPHFHTCRPVFRIQLAQIAGPRILSNWRALHTLVCDLLVCHLGRHQRTIA